MRQFFTWRWWLTIGALVGTALLLFVVLGRPGGDTLADEVEPAPRRVDLIVVPRAVDPNVGWQVRDGVTRGRAVVRLDDGRRFVLDEGTYGENDCTRIEQERGCVLLADTLGGAVIWFALLDAPDPDGEVRLPPIRTLLEGVTWARLSNGWELPLLSIVERRCSKDTINLGNFVDTFGDRAWSYLDLTEGEISAVQCRKN